MTHKKYTIIHLDDNPDITDRMDLFLDDSNEIKYEYIHNIEDAFKRLSQGLPHLMLVDLMLEDDINADPGINFIKQAKKEYPKLNIMVLSNRGDMSIRNELKEYVIDYEEKIFRPSVYMEKILTILNQLDTNHE